MNQQIQHKIELAIASRRPDLLVLAIESLLPIGLSWLEKWLGLKKDRKLELINILIQSLPDQMIDAHFLKDSVRYINENY